MKVEETKNKKIFNYLTEAIGKIVFVVPNERINPVTNKTGFSSFSCSSEVRL